MLDAVVGHSWLKMFLLASSSDVYGFLRPRDLPVKPDRLPNPVSPYARSKVAAEYLVRTYCEQYQVPAVIVRAFNHTGPRQSADFVIPAFCKKIVRAERSRGRKTVSVGNLEARRDISDVRDIVRGYRLLAEKGRPGRIYHLCSGRARRIGDLLERLLIESRMPIKVVKDKRIFRPTDLPILQGSNFSSRRDTGWRPEIPIEETLADCLSFWRELRI